MSCLKECTQLSELALDGNPVYNKKGYLEFCLVSCPNLKQLDLRKITPEMRDSNLDDLKKSKEGGNGSITDGANQSSGNNQGSTTAASTDSPDKV